MGGKTDAEVEMSLQEPLDENHSEIPDENFS